VLFDLARTLQGARAQVSEGKAGAGAFLMGAGELVTLARSLGLLETRVEAMPAVDGRLKTHIESLVWLREEARKKRDFAEADRLRAELDKMNVVLEDSREGTTWRLRR